MQNYIFDILLARMQWAEILVRKKTAFAIKEMLLENAQLKNLFLNWLNEQSLESKVLEVLTIVYLVQEEKNEYFSFKEVDENIKAPSFLSELLLSNIFNKKLFDNKNNRKWVYSHSDNAPRGFKNKERLEYIKLAVIEQNLEKLKMIASPLSLPIQEQFDYEWTFLMEQQNNFYSSEPKYFFESHKGKIADVRTNQKDVLESSFLRVISWLVYIGMPISYAHFLTLDFLPACLGLIKVLPFKRPHCLDLFSKKNFNFLNFEKDDFIPVSINAPLKFEENKISGIEMYGILNFDKNKKPKELFELCQNNYLETSTLNIEKLDFKPKNNYLGLTLLKYRYWHSLYSLYRGIFIPNIDNLNFKAERDKLLFVLEGEIIGYWQYWYDNYETSFHPNAELPCGTISYFSKDFIKKLCKNSNFSAVVNLKNYSKENNYDKNFAREDEFYIIDWDYD